MGGRIGPEYAGMAPLARSRADEAKSMADAILRRIEMSDGLGTPIPALEAEQIKEDSSAIIDYLARRQPEDLRPYASPLDPGAGRLVENVREAAWWSARLARELARWEYFWASAFGVTCVGALYHFSTSLLAVSTNATAGARDAAEFAAALLVFVFAEGFYRRAREFKAFAEQSQRAFERAERQHESGEAPSLAGAFNLATDYYLARQASPRLSSRWYKWRRARLNAAWLRAQADDDMERRLKSSAVTPPIR